jgi:hypothetical protein
VPRATCDSGEECLRAARARIGVAARARAEASLPGAIASAAALRSSRAPPRRKAPDADAVTPLILRIAEAEGGRGRNRRGNVVDAPSEMAAQRGERGRRR